MDLNYWTLLTSCPVSLAKLSPQCLWMTADFQDVTTHRIISKSRARSMLLMKKEIYRVFPVHESDSILRHATEDIRSAQQYRSF
jgi:hypothetical protein